MIPFFSLFAIVNLIIFDKFSGDSPVPVDIFLLSKGHKLRIFRIVDSIKDSISDKFCPCSLTKRHVSGPQEVRDEAGETVLGRTDSHVGEVQVRDGEGLDGGGDGTAGPAREGLMDQDPSSSEASDDDTEPEKSGKPSFISDMGKTMYGGGTQELLHTMDTNHPSGLLDTETFLGLI